MHWPTDVLASLILGSAVASVTFSALSKPLAPVLDWVLGLYRRMIERPAR